MAISLGLLTCLLPDAVGKETSLELRKGDVVAFIGGTDMVRMQKEGLLEAALTHRFRALKPLFRDLAWDGDTVTFQGTIGERWRRQAFGDWKTQLNKVGATVVVAQFGKMESIGGVEKLDSFIRDYGKLLDQVSGDGRRLVLLAPSGFEWKDVPAQALKEYSVAIEKLAKERGVPFIRGDNAAEFAKSLSGVAKPSPGLIRAVQAKHRLWYEYWRPANWKCLFGDDRRRVFSNASHGLPSLKQEWETYPKLIEAAEKMIFSGGLPEVRKPSPLTGSRDASPEKELAAFEVLEGFEVNLFADESNGIGNPLSVRWDTAGRMYVACSDVYPQIEPGTLVDDKIIRLVDTDNDGRADKSNVFARGLNIPTGMEVGHDRVYVGQGTELLELRDTNGDGVADQRKVLLSGFGNGDSHQTINSLVWSPGGELWFCQGDGVESRVETPFGVSSLYQAGVFRLRPHELRLDGLLDDFMGPGNPWGVVFDDFGQSFVIDGAGGISYLTPASIPARRRLRLPRIGRAGGYCGVECIGAANFPADMQGDHLLGDYKKNQVSRYRVVPEGAGFKVEWKAPLLRSSHRNFRPIDVKTGPDGAIYIVDWYNPITCHQDDFFRHPNRDKTHGRIWRVTPKSGSLKPPGLVKASVSNLLNALESPERWTRLKAKQVLASRDAGKVIPALESWASTPQRHFAAVTVLEWLNAPGATLLHKLLKSPDPRGRAYAARVAGRWGTRLKQVWELLESAAGDPHPQVRMEALLACGQVPDPRSILVAATAAEHPRDRWIDYAFSQAMFQLKPIWVPAFRRGELDFGDRRRGLAAVLGQSDSRSLLDDVRRLLKSGDLTLPARVILCKALIAAGEENDLRMALEFQPPSRDILQLLAGCDRPGFDAASSLGKLLAMDMPSIRTAALDLIGHWRVQELRPGVMQSLEAHTLPAVRFAAIRTLGQLGGEDARQSLKALAAEGKDDLRGSAVMALLGIDAGTAARQAASLLAESKSDPVIRKVFIGFSSRQNGLQKLSAALSQVTIDSSQGKLLSNAWIALGVVDVDMATHLHNVAGIESSKGQYQHKDIEKLVASAREGNASRGKALFNSARLGCVACHKVGVLGGSIGPDLTALGSGLPPDRTVVEVLWPGEQVKEGYSLSRVTLKDQRVLQGYVQDGRDSKVLLLRDFSSTRIESVPRGDIIRTEVVGSLMPGTAQTLSRSELADLLAYLFNLRGR